MAYPVCSPGASSSHEVPPAAPSEKLEQDMKALKDGIAMLFTNEFQQAEDAFRQGASQERFRPPPDYKGAVRDSRGTFALVYAIVSFMFGLLSFANDQLDECLSRVWAAESLLLEDAPWVGQKMLLGMAYLIAGVVQAAKNAWLKSGVNLVRSLRFISVFEEGLHFEGPEAPMVRSFSLFFLGLFNLVLSMLPPQMLKIASRAGGRSLHGSRGDAIRLLTDCHEQDGVMAPFAVLVLLAYNISMKQHIGEGFTEEDFERSRELLQWASERFPGSAVFGFWQTELHTVRTEIEEACLVVDKVSAVLTQLNLPAVDSFLEQKKAMLSLALLDWENAAIGFERSLAVSVAKQRRSYVPTLSYLAGLCRTLCSSSSSSDAHAYENFSRVHQYSKMRKRNWPPEDDLTFLKVKEFGPKFSVDRERALTELAEIVMIKISGLHTMPETAKRELQGMLLPRVDDPVAEEAARALLISAELGRLLGETEDAKRLALRGLDLAPRLGARGASNGTIATLHLVLAMLDVDGHMEAMEKCPKCCRAYDESLKFKRAGLARKIADAQENGASRGRKPSLGASMPPDSSALVDADMEEADEDEFFSAEDEEDRTLERTAPRSLGSWFRRREKPASLHNVDTDEPTCSAPGSPCSSSPSQSSLSWASEFAVKAIRDLAKKSAVAGGELRLKASEQLGPLLERPLAQAVGLNSALGSTGRRRKSSSGSSKLHLEALLKQANQGDCSIVCMPTPGPDAPETEVVAYLRWAHWSSLRGVPRNEALRQHGILSKFAR